MAIAHIGASVAVEDVSESGERSLAAMRLAMTSLANDEAASIAAALAPAGLALGADTTDWLGEGRAFSRLAAGADGARPAPLLSFTGSGIDFHTPEDTPERATSPAALAAVATGIGDAVAALVEIATSKSEETQL